jgi:integrase
MDNDVIYRNVFAAIKVPCKAPARRRPLTDDETRLVMDTYTGHRMGVSVLLLLYCGLRRGELVALTWGDVSIKNKTVTMNKAAVFNGNTTLVQNPKTESGTRTIPLPNSILDAVKAARRASQSTMVCPAADGKLLKGRGRAIFTI